jgi:hypothetical protein
MKKYSTGVSLIDMMLIPCSVKIFRLLQKLKLGHTHGECGNFTSFASQLSRTKEVKNAATSTSPSKANGLSDV